MIKKVKQTPLTLEAFKKVIMPKINEKFDELNEKIKFLPSTEVYLKSQDELMGELQKLREGTALTGLHGEKIRCIETPLAKFYPVYETHTNPANEDEIARLPRIDVILYEYMTNASSIVNASAESLINKT